MGTRDETKWDRRDRKHRKRRFGMRVNGTSIKAVLLRVIGRKAKAAQEKHNEETQATATRHPKKRPKRNQ